MADSPMNPEDLARNVDAVLADPPFEAKPAATRADCALCGDDGPCEDCAAKAFKVAADMVEEVAQGTAPILAAHVEAAVASVRAERDALAAETLQRAAGVARGCRYNYLAGYGGAELEAYRHGFETVARVLEAMAAGGDLDTRIVERLGKAAALAGSTAALDAVRDEAWREGWEAGRETAAEACESRRRDALADADDADLSTYKERARREAKEARACADAIRALVPPARQEVGRG